MSGSSASRAVPTLRRSTTAARWTLAGCVALMGCLTLGPLPTGLLRDVTDAVAAALGAPARPLDQTVEKVSNVAMFFPATALTAFAFPRIALRLVFAGAVVASVAVESAQLLLIAGRHPSLLDVALNVAGAALGVAAARRLSRPPEPARAKVQARPPRLPTEIRLR